MDASCKNRMALPLDQLFVRTSNQGAQRFLLMSHREIVHKSPATIHSSSPVPYSKHLKPPEPLLIQRNPSSSPDNSKVDTKLGYLLYIMNINYLAIILVLFAPCHDVVQGRYCTVCTTRCISQHKVRFTN
ncbi:hypothetical protein L873DRAFT_658185 [Choiromyces venosus 120613-1]|uniref:Uncharacterized protein n=1 Tax=Choiromyces venosus 120613-1 TaxID=1336337 RepID=A0A3N4JTF7_9PEZI|nr:hypothetical protein L873DRAFT_658185 [Choiromyces venosus 120613-1]